RWPDRTGGRRGSASPDGGRPPTAAGPVRARAYSRLTTPLSVRAEGDKVSTNDVRGDSSGRARWDAGIPFFKLPNPTQKEDEPWRGRCAPPPACRRSAVP